MPLLLIAGIFLFVDELNLTPYTDTISTKFNKSTGRSLEINGELRVTLSLDPSLTVSQVKMGNPEWAKEPVFFSADQLNMQLSIESLFNQGIDSLILKLTDATINAERNKDGKTSWNFSDSGHQHDDDDEFGLKRGDFPKHMEIDIANAVLNFTDDEMEQSWSLQLDTGQLISPKPGESISVSVHGIWDEKPVNIEGTMGPVSEPAHYPVKLSGELLGINGSVDGRIPLAIDKSDSTQFAVELKSDSLKPLRDILGASIPAIGPASIKFTAEGKTGVIEFTDVNATIQKGTISGKLKLSEGKHRPLLSGSLNLNNVDFEPWIPEQIESEKSVPKGSNPFSTEKIDLTANRLFDANMTLSGRNIHLPLRTIPEITGSYRRNNGNIDVSIKAAGHHAPLTVNLSVKRTKNGQAINLKVHDEKLNWDEILRGSDLKGSITGHLNIDVDIAGSGRTPAEFLGSLDGRAVVLMGKGTAQLGSLDRVVGGTTAVLGQMFSSNAEHSTINCMAADLKLDNGQANINLGLIDTQYSTVVIQGKLDLKSGTVDLKTSPTPKGVTLSVAAPVKITGPINDPNYSLEKGGALFVLGDLITKTVFPETLVLSIFGDAVRGNSCVKIAQSPQKSDSTENIEEETKAPEKEKPVKQHALDIIGH